MTASPEKPAPEEAAAAPAAPSSSNKPLMAILGINTLLLGALVVVPLVRPAPAAAPAAAAHGSGADDEGGSGSGEDEGSHGSGSGAPRAPIINMGTYTIRLRSADAERYGRFGFDAQMTNAKDADKVKDLMPLIRDRIIMVLSAKTVDDLAGPEGLEAVKDELRKALNEIIPGQHLQALFLNEFVVQ